MTEIEAGKTVIAEMKNALAARESEIAALNTSLEEARNAAVTVAKSLATAVGAYRELIVQGNPGVLAEMIGGESIEKVDAVASKCAGHHGAGEAGGRGGGREGACAGRGAAESAAGPCRADGAGEDSNRDKGINLEHNLSKTIYREMKLN